MMGTDQRQRSAAGTRDFRRFFESAPVCCLMLAPDLTIVAVSDAYLRATMTKRDDVVGRGIFEVFPDNPDDPGATGVANLRASLARVLLRKAPDAMAVQKYDIRRPQSVGGRFEERHWSPVNSPVLGDDGDVDFIIHHVEDVTDVVLLERQGRERDRTIQELSVRSEERHGQLLDTAPDAMVVVGADGRIDLVNVRTETMFGYTRSELIGQHLDILIPERFRRGHAAHLQRFFAHPGARPMGSGLELFGRRRDGSEIPIEVSLSPLHIGECMTVSAAIRDISERKRMEASAKRMADRLASAVESIQDAFALFDDDDRLILCNSVYRRFLGDSLTGPVVGRSYEELLDAWIGDIAFPDEDQGARARFRQERLERRRHEDTTTFDVRTRDGRSLRIVDRRTAEGGLVKTIWDLTDDEHRAEELRAARAAAEAGSAAKSEFLSSMSHELRTPLNAILGFAQLLRRDKKAPLAERHLERIDQILRGGQHLLRLIDDILDLSRIEAGGVSISTEPVSVVDVLEEVKRTLEPMAVRQDVRVGLEALPDLPLVAADRTRLAQILMNFGSNAIKYNRQGGTVTFLVTIPQAGRLRVTVRDTGAGIPADKQETLFHPFQRAGQENGPIQGTGIGLVITKRLAELMSGRVGFRSVAGQGSEFWVEIPVHASGARSDAAPSARESEARPLMERRKVVLYVEDNPANVAFMKDLMGTCENIDLLAVPTAEMGVELARLRQPDVIVMDINLPGMSGPDALRELRAAPETKDIPVMALTAAASERDRRRGMDAGFDQYLTKPVNVDDFMTALETVFASLP
jgi:PAS domain S-box-containing protein